jgi:hypothetical protein
MASSTSSTRSLCRGTGNCSQPPPKPSVDRHLRCTERPYAGPFFIPVWRRLICAFPAQTATAPPSCRDDECNRGPGAQLGGEDTWRSMRRRTNTRLATLTPVTFIQRKISRLRCRTADGFGVHMRPPSLRAALQLRGRRSQRDLTLPALLTLERFHPLPMAIAVDRNTSFFACAKNVTSSD